MVLSFLILAALTERCACAISGYPTLYTDGVGLPSWRSESGSKCDPVRGLIPGWYAAHFGLFFPTTQVGGKCRGKADAYDSVENGVVRHDSCRRITISVGSLNSPSRNHCMKFCLVIQSADFSLTDAMLTVQAVIALQM